MFGHRRPSKQRLYYTEVQYLVPNGNTNSMYGLGNEKNV